MGKKDKKKKPSDGRTLVAQNRRARYDYAISDTFEAGLSLLGSEVKAVRNGDVQINEAFVLIRRGEAQLHNVYIGEYANAAAFPHETRRMRKLLLNRREIDRLSDAQQLKGLSIIPLSIYFKQGWLKCELGLGKGKTNVDRRET
ncbi:MAG: SsrA-binding protein SmpB, partial [Myxococcota bacterium]